MATRSLICYENVEKKEITVSYCHWDGYIKGGVGETLIKNYSGENAKVFATGRDMSTLHETLETSEIHEGSEYVPAPFKKGVFSFVAALASGEYDVRGAEFIYIHTDAFGWIVAEVDWDDEGKRVFKWVDPEIVIGE